MYIYTVLTLEKHQVAIQLFYRYKVAKRSYSSQLGIKERTRNLELSSKSKGEAVLPPFYKAEIYSMFLPVRWASCSGRFSTRTAPRLIGSRRAWLRTATLTSPGSATNPSTSEFFSKNPRENNHFIYLRGGENAACLRHLSFRGKNCSFLFSFTKIFET